MWSNVQFAESSDEASIVSPSSELQRIVKNVTTMGIQAKQEIGSV